MQSRKHESISSQSAVSRLRYHHQFESGIDPYSGGGSRRGNVPAEQSVRRSFSPREFSRNVGVTTRIGSDDRREYGWLLGDSRSDRMRQRSRSRSPNLPYSDVRTRPHLEEVVRGLRGSYSPEPASLELRRRHEMAEPRNFSVNDDLSGRKVYGSEHNDSRISKEKLTESGLPVGKHGTFSNKSIHMEDDAVRGSKSLLIEDDTVLGTYWSPTDPRPVITPGQSGGRQPVSSRRMSIRHFDQGKHNYLDPVALDRLPVTESYKEGENPIFTSMDASYPLRSGAHSKKVLASSSTGIRSEYQDSYRGGRHIPSFDEFSSSSRKLADSFSINTYRQRALADSSGDPYSGKRNLTFHDRRSPTRGEDDNYFYPKSRGMAVDDRGYPSDDFRMMPPRSPLNYDHTEVVYDHILMDPVMERTDNSDYSGNPRKIIMLNNARLKRKSSSDHPDIRRISEASKHGREYLGSKLAHADFRKRMSQDYEVSHLSASPEGDISYRKEDYSFERDSSVKFQKRLLPGSKYDSEVHRHTVELQMREENGIYEPSDRVRKRNYVIEEEKSIRRTNMPGKWRSRDFQDLYDRPEEWNDEDIGGMHTSASAGFDYNKYIKAARVYDVLDHQFEYESDDWVPSQHSLAHAAHAQRHSVRFHKHGDRYIKGHQKSGYMSRHNLNYTDNKSRVYKQHRDWKRNDNYLEDLDEGDGNDADTSENGVSSAGPEPPEDSEEFMQMVHDAFLNYSKKLNMNTAVQRRYKSQGKAGPLFCIVCGRSLSKEFMDTQRLVTHAFMSHKVGLRAEHLGLLKAVCVLLGWSTVVPSDTVTWVPQVLSKAEALAQKEDLILWPPVIIVHNISMSDDNPESWKVVTMEAVEVFLRGKGLIRGRIKMCLGKPADQSVFVVKFLGTFTGLGDAERIQQYFTEHKHGRLDFERATSYNGKTVEAGMQGESLEERLLYGYMGIVEDLDKVDYNTRNWCVIKSKNEIQDLANAPVRSDDK